MITLKSNRFKDYKEPDSDLFYRPSVPNSSVWTKKRSCSNFKRISSLGRGHSSKVFKVQNTVSEKLYAEKVRDSSGLAKLVYFASFQAPSPDRNENATRVAVLTRNVLYVLTKKWHEEDGRVPLIANAVGYRWDEEEKTYSILTDFIDGRGPKPNSHEIFDLMESMDLLQTRLFDAGLYGPAWQADKSNMTSTSNFKYSEKDNQWYWIDTEPGMIALRFGRQKKYLKAAKRCGFSPLYADIDFEKLKSYIKDEQIEGLDKSIDSLEHNMKCWKEREIALFRKNNKKSKKIKKWYIWNWHQERNLSEKTENKLNKSNFAFFIYLFLGNLLSFSFNQNYRARKIEKFFRKLEDDDIIEKGYRKHYGLNRMLKLLCPKSIHHYLMSKPFRKYINKGFFNRKHRIQIAKDFIDNGIQEWEDSNRLSKKDSEKIRNSYKNNVSMDVYLTGFGVHLLLKGFTIIGDLLALINFLGASGVEFFKFLTLEFLLIDFLPWPLNALWPLLIGPIIRLSFVTYSKIRCALEGRNVPHKIAALVSFGKFGVGNMAFPAQMLYSENSFSLGLLLSKMGKKFPVFGGTDSRVEHWFIRRQNMKDTLASYKLRIANSFSFARKTPSENEMDYQVPKARGFINKRKGEPRIRMVNLFAIFIYLAAFTYIIIFRVLNEIVGSAEPEYFPIEILTTANVILVMIFIYLIYEEDKLKIGSKNILYLFLILTFMAYYLAENNWLPQRSTKLGIVVYGALIGMVFLLAIRRIYRVDRRACAILILGIGFLVSGTIVDASSDGNLPITFGISRVGLIEEVLELYASLFFLHCFSLLYFSSKAPQPVMVKRRLDIAVISLGGLFFGFGNSFFICDHGREPALEQVMLGLSIVTFGLIMVFMILVNRKLQKSNSTPEICEV
jgi:hypothetical protein